MKARVFLCFAVAIFGAGCAADDASLDPVGQGADERQALLEPLPVLAIGETATGSFQLTHLPRMPLLLVAECVSPDQSPLSTAEVVVNGHCVLTAGDLAAGSHFERREILPDILRLGENTVEARAQRVEDGEDGEVALVVTVFGD